MTAAMDRRLAKLEQAATDERQREPYQIRLEVGDDDFPPCDPWVPGTRITCIRLMPLKAEPGDPNYGRQFNTDDHLEGGSHA